MASATEKVIPQGGVEPGTSANQQLPSASQTYPQPQQHHQTIMYPHPAAPQQQHYQAGCPLHHAEGQQHQHQPIGPVPNYQLDQVTVVPFVAQPSQLNKSTTMAVYFCLPILGMLGLHHFYLNRPFMGYIYAFTLGLFCLGWMVDLFRIKSLVRECNYQTSQAQIRGYQLHSSRFPTPITKISLLDAYLLWLPPVGLLGFYQYYLGRPRIGKYHTFTLGRCCLGWLFDLCRIPAMVRNANAEFAMMKKGIRVDDDPPFSVFDAYSLAFPLGIFGLHHFYLGNTKRGILFLCTLGVFGLGWLADMFQMPMIVSEANKNKELKKRLTTALASNGQNTNTSVVVVTTTTATNQGYSASPGDGYGAMPTGAMPAGATGGAGVVHEPPPVYKAQAGEGESVVVPAGSNGGVSGHTSYGSDAAPNPPVDKNGFFT